MVERLSPTPGQTILEIAAGAGETGFAAAAPLGAQGRLISSDVAPLMVEAARRVAKEMAVHNVEFRVMDAERLDLPDASVDGVICRYGYMLMNQPDKGLRETRRVLRPGGRLVLAVWGDPKRNPWMTIPRRMMTELGHMPPPDPTAPGMFSMHDPAKLQAQLRSAGFAHCEYTELPVTHRFKDADSLWQFTSELQGPIALAIEKLSADARAAVRRVLEQQVAPFRVGEGYQLPGLSLNAVAY